MKKLALAAALALLAAPAMAHTGHGGVSGLGHGLMHPILGPDHLLAMLAVGLWSGYVLPNRFWLGTAAFMSAMALGAGISWAGLTYPTVEGVILGSVLVFGLLVLVARPDQSRAVTRAALAAVAVFASAHGYAHASEAEGNVLAYLAGFLIATAALHLLGVALARSVAARPTVQCLMGTGIAGAGLLMMAG